MILSLFLLSNIFILVASDGYVCGGTLRNPPTDLNEPYYFPDGWNEGMQPATFNASQGCNWQINVLDGMYATVVFYKNADELDTSIYATYPNYDRYNLDNNDEAPFIFTSGQFQITLLANQTQGQFSFKVVWSYYPANICKSSILLGQYQLIPAPSSDCVVTFTAPNRVWLAAFSGKLYKSPILRHSAVFEGDLVDGEFLGTLRDASDENIKSDGKSLTIYTFGMKFQDNRNLFLGLDVRAAGNVRRFRGLDCTDENPAYCSIYPTATNFGLTAYVTASRNVDYLYYNQKFTENGTLSIYETQIDNTHLLATMTDFNYYQQLPIAVKNTVKIYVMNRGSASITLTNNATEADYGNIAILRNYGMRRIVHSFDYHRSSPQQDTFENFTTGGTLVNFNFNVVYFDINGPTTLDIKVLQKGTAVFSQQFTALNQPLSTIYTVLGDFISVNYQTYGFKTNGFEVNFVCTEKNDVVATTPVTATTQAFSITSRSEVTTTVPKLTSPTTIIPIVPSTIETTTRGSKRNFGLLVSVVTVAYFLYK